MSRRHRTARTVPAAPPLAELYARLPTLDCKGMCQESCGPVPAGPAELAAVAAAGTELASLRTPGEIAGALARGDLNGPDGDIASCPALGGLGTCTVYAVRPMVCRLWGTVASMPCPFGCVPSGGHLPDATGHALLSAAMRATR